MRHLIYAVLLSLLFGCSSSTMLDRPFNPQTYDEDLLFMLEKKQLSQGELFNLVYTIIRQREYFNYDLEGKTYGDILEMGQRFRAEGFPVEQTRERNGEQEAVAVTIENEGTAYIRKQGSQTRMEKKLKFAAEFSNTSDEPVILLSTTFLFDGPFHDYLSQAAYQLNCLLEPGQRKRVNFLAEATNIRDNMLQGGAFDIRLLSVDSLLTGLTISVGGNSITHDIRYYDNCKFGSARVSPVKQYIAKDHFNAEEQITRNTEGKATAINWGETHYLISDSDEVVRMRR